MSPGENLKGGAGVRGGVFLRFSRFRFKEGNEGVGLAILRNHAKAMAASPGCQEVFLAQGQHPSTEFVVVAIFEDDAKLRSFEVQLRSDPELGGDFFSLLRLTTQPPEVTQYEVRDRDA